MKIEFMQNGLGVCFVVAALQAAVAADAPGTVTGIGIDPTSKAADGQVVVHDMVETGPIRLMHGVNGCPIGEDEIACWKAAGIPYSRTHDLNLVHGYGGPYVIDVPWIFRNFDADENDPKAYEFDMTDELLQRIRETGAEPFYRLGAAFESRHTKKHTCFPPKDYAKWARICEHIIAHYNEGWANGFRWNIKYWEIWNEPGLRESPGGGGGVFWHGPTAEFKKFFKVSLRHLKKRFPDLKFGGAGICCHDFGSEIIREFGAEKVPLDFYSWHLYGADPRAMAAKVRGVRKELDAVGYTKTESINDEWNYMRSFERLTRQYGYEVEYGRYSEKGAAFIAAVMSAFQDAPLDISMFYDARHPGMNSLFDGIHNLPMRGYYPFLIWNSLFKLGMQVRTEATLKDVYVTAAKDESGNLGILVVRYSDDNNQIRPVRVTVRLASKKPLVGATLHLTDDKRIHTQSYFHPNVDGSVDLTLRPSAFAYFELRATP